MMAMVMFGSNYNNFYGHSSYWKYGTDKVPCRSQNTGKSYARQRETTGSGNDSLQLRPFSKWELLFKERICSQWERILSFKSSFLWYGNHVLPH